MNRGGGNLIATECLLSARHCIDTLPDTLFVFPTSLQGRYYPHFADEESEAQRSYVICPRSHSWWVTVLGLEPLFLGCEACVLPLQYTSLTPRSLGQQTSRLFSYEQLSDFSNSILVSVLFFKLSFSSVSKMRLTHWRKMESVEKIQMKITTLFTNLPSKVTHIKI